MDVSMPIRSISTAVDLEIIVHLDGINVPLSARSIAANIDRNHAWVNTALLRLVEQGTVIRQMTGLYVINRDHLAYPAIAALSSMRSRLIFSMKEDIEAWKILPIYASIFGSFARKDGDSESDIDVFLVRPQGEYNEEQWQEQIDTFSNKFTIMTGNTVNPIEYDVSEIHSAQLFTEVVSDEIVLYGKSLAKLLKK